MGPLGFLTMKTRSEIETMVGKEEEKILLTWLEMKDRV